MKLSDIVAHDGWKIVRRRFTEMTLALGDIFGFREADPAKLLHEIAARQMAIELVMNWIRDVEGSARQHQTNSEAYEKMREESIFEVEE